MKHLFKNNYLSFNTCLDKHFYDFSIGKSDYVPQGICNINDNIIVSFYDSSHTLNSVLLIYNKDSIKKVFLDGKYHCGGIAYHEHTDSLFVTGIGFDDKAFINRYCGKDLLRAKSNDTIYVDKIYEVDNNYSLYSTSAKHSSASYLSISDNDLYVGNYVNYDLTNKYKSILKKYKILSNGDLSATYDIYNNPFSNTQGVCIYKYKNKNYFIFSRSFGRKRNSLINIAVLENASFICLNAIVLPSMLEQVNTYNDKIAVIFESSARIYHNSITKNDGVYLLNFSKMLKCNDNKKIFSNGKGLFVCDNDIDIYGKMDK